MPGAGEYPLMAVSCRHIYSILGKSNGCFWEKPTFSPGKGWLTAPKLPLAETLLLNSENYARWLLVQFDF